MEEDVRGVWSLRQLDPVHLHLVSSSRRELLGLTGETLFLLFRDSAGRREGVSGGCNVHTLHRRFTVCGGRPRINGLFAFLHSRFTCFLVHVSSLVSTASEC